MIELGKYNELKILKRTKFGLYLGDETGEEVLLPNKYCPESFKLEDEIKVFVYLDHEERKIATNIKPKILLHEYALLKVTSVEDVGAFLDWGLEKELLVPFKEQRQKMEAGRWYIVFLDIDIKSDRLYATNKIEQRLQNEFLTVKEGDEVDLLVLQKTDLGFSVIVNNGHKGLIFKNEIFKELKDGIGSLSSLMEEAIAWNRTDFVQLFFENGYSLDKYLTYGNLLHLYNKVKL